MERSISLSHHDTLLRRARHAIFVIFGVMNGLLIPLVIIGLIAIIDHKILSDWLKEDEGRLPIFFLASIGFLGILVMILIRGKMMGVKLTLILIALTALSSMINNIHYHILQAPKIIKIFYYDVKTTKSLGIYVFSMILWLGPGLILFWLHALFQRPPRPLSPLIKHKRAVMIKHIGSACYLYLPIVMSMMLLIIVTDIASGVPIETARFFFNALVFFAPIDSKDVIFFKWGIPFPLQAAFYSLGILLIYWRYVSLGFLMRLIVSLLPSLWVNFFAFAYSLACIDC